MASSIVRTSVLMNRSVASYLTELSTKLARSRSMSTVLLSRLVCDGAAYFNPSSLVEPVPIGMWPRAVAVDGQVRIATLMTCTLSVDHRVIDGAVAAEFLQAFKRSVEDPIALLI